MPRGHDSDNEGPNIVDQVLRDGGDDDDADRREDDYEDNTLARESGELNLNDNVGGEDARSDSEDDQRQKDRGTNNSATNEGDSIEKKKDHPPCCVQCQSKNKNNGRACICQVPSKLRRGSLGKDGCFTCHCTGCHPDDADMQQGSRSDPPERSERSSRGSEEHSRQPRSERPGRVERIDRERFRSFDRRDKRVLERGNDDEILKNGCCRACMKAFSDTKRACLCQVPFDVRLGVLPDNGCKICGCKGCHPEETMVRRGIQPPRARPLPLPTRYNPYPPLPPYYPPPVPPLRHTRDDRHHGLLPFPMTAFPYPPPPGPRDYDPLRLYERDPYRDMRERGGYERNHHDRDHRERERDGGERDTRDRDSRDRERGRERERDHDIRALRDDRERERDHRRGTERDYDRDREFEERSRSHYERELHLQSKRPREREYHARSPPVTSKRMRASPM